VTAVALLVAVLPPLLFAQPFWGTHGWLMRALQLLVIACPCALVLSTPVSLVSAMTAAASRGVLIKGGRYLEVLSRVRAVAFDKTGTLTAGRPVATDVVDVCTCGECAEGCGLLHAAALEAQSSHPLGRALVAEAQARQMVLPPAQEVTALSGRGVQGVVNGASVTDPAHRGMTCAACVRHVERALQSGGRHGRRTSTWPPSGPPWSTSRASPPGGFPPGRARGGL
jgi:Cd2+/Zn2+-exporting ATPase